MRRMALIIALTILAVPVWSTGQQQAEAEPVELVVWDQFTAEGTLAAIEAIQESFLEKYPNVVIERNAMTSGEMSDVLRPALQSGSGPDVFFSEVGIGFVGPILKAGYIMDLTEAWETRGWDAKLFPMSREIPSVAGVTYGVGHQLEFVPIYYNKSIFGELGLEVPETIDELTDIAEQVKDAGYTPFAWGGLDWWPNSNLTTAALWARLGQDTVQDALYEGASWDLPGTRDAIRTVFVDWVERGYFPPNAEALNYDDMLMVFHQGDAAMLLTGNWIVGNLRTNIQDFEVGSFLWPPADASMDSNTVSFVGSGYLVAAQTDVPDVAINYVDHVMADPESARIWYEVADTIPPLAEGIDLDSMDVDPLVAETYEALTGTGINVTAGLSMSAPPQVMTFLETSAVQVMTGQLSPDGWVEEFQRLWDEARAAGDTVDTFEY